MSTDLGRPPVAILEGSELGTETVLPESRRPHPIDPGLIGQQPGRPGFGFAHRTHAPRFIPGSKGGPRTDIDPLARNREISFPAPELGEARSIHNAAAFVVHHVLGFEVGECPRRKSQIALDPGFVGGKSNAQGTHGLHHLDFQGTELALGAIPRRPAGTVKAVLDAVNRNAPVSVEHLAIGIDPHAALEEKSPFAVIPVHPVPIVEISIRRLGLSNRLTRLMNQVVVHGGNQVRFLSQPKPGSIISRRCPAAGSTPR